MVQATGEGGRSRTADLQASIVSSQRVILCELDQIAKDKHYRVSNIREVHPPR